MEPAMSADTEKSTTTTAPYDQHDWEVMQRINGFISEVNQRFPKLTVAEKLEDAWGKNVAEREESPANSIDPVGRDADYYFAARKELAKDKSKVVQLGKEVIGHVAYGVYTSIKEGLDFVGRLDLIRSHSAMPNAPTGGYIWMKRGIADGKRDPGHMVADVILHQPNPNETHD